MTRARRLAAIRAHAERRRRFAAWLVRRGVAEPDWPPADELAELLAPAARATVRQAGAGARYAGLGFEWARDWAREAPIRTAEADGARPRTEGQAAARRAARKPPADRQQTASRPPAMPPTVYIGEAARLALELAASASRTAYTWPAPPPAPFLRPYGMPVHLALSGAFGPGAFHVAILRRGPR